MLWVSSEYFGFREKRPRREQRTREMKRLISGECWGGTAGEVASAFVWFEGDDWNRLGIKDKGVFLHDSQLFDPEAS